MKSGNRIHEHAANGELKELQQELERGVPVDVQAENGTTPLFAAAFHGKLECVEFLISQGAKVDIANVAGYTPLMAAAREKHPRIVEALLIAGADPELVAESGNKAVHWGIMDTIPKKPGSPYETESLLIDVLEAFRRNRADLHTKTANGRTTLMDAAWWGLVDTTRYLLQSGADPNAKDNDGQIAEDYARSKIAKHLNAQTDARCKHLIGLLHGKSADKPWWKFW